MVSGEIIIIGDEILEGEVLDTNSFDVAKTLSEAGFCIARMLAIGDNEDVIKNVLKEAIPQYDFLIFTGGLGPTWDDKTVRAVAEALDLPLEQNAEAYSHLQETLAKQGKKFLGGHQKMTILPRGAKPLGIAYRACGFKLIYQNKPLYFLPGVPHQMRQILKEKVVSDLKGIYPHVTAWYKKKLRLFGISESQIQEKISLILETYPQLKMSSLPHFPEIHLILRTPNKDTLERAALEIKNLFKENIFGEGDQTLPEVVAKLLLKQGLKLATAESLTGGLIGHLITQVPGSSDFFEQGAITYSNQAKIDVLGVPLAIIREHGAVSEPTARYMAEGIKKIAHVDIGLAVTGYAGPTAGPEGPVGTVFIGMSTPKVTEVKKFQFEGSRTEIKLLTAFTGLDMIRRYLLS